LEAKNEHPGPRLFFLRRGWLGLGLALLCLLGSAFSFAEGRNMLITENRWQNLVPGVATEAQVVAILGVPEDRAENVRYGSLQALTLLDYAPATSIYLREDRVLLIGVAPVTANGLERKLAAWKTALGQAPERILDSRAGKNGRVYLYAAKGLALHEVEGEVEAVEIFPSMTVDAYLKHLYVQPLPFTK
jgi:hypothetical protein